MSRLSQMIAHELKRSNQSASDISRHYKWSKQSFSTWLNGALPRQQFHQRLAEFLKISLEDLQMLIDEAQKSTGNTKIPNLGSPILGRGTASKLTIDQFAMGYAKPNIDGCYAVRIDGRIHWVNPSITPADGNSVLVKENGAGYLATWPVQADGDVHVVVLAEMA
ncbi:XRE family transcriptional regulator [Rhizobium tumorigenes]|uniref:XRE family transcriptional regulator n=1 Tax=Rhizobium tumorigenes TaxID=2041385 RepID=UPI00241C6D9E|nr:XRE family transcriptional regulator [Rhizobium tumorigenes]WFS02794.1 XRE family transcriptional regulator [Rhizobium tumorigenes]